MAPEAAHGPGEFLTMRVPSFDGTVLHVDVQLPDGEGPFPTVLTYTPYSVLGAQADGAQADAGLPFDAQFMRLLPYGYAVGVAHVRGTGESGGCLTVGGPEEGRDGYAIVEAIANQSWSNGKVALGGTSWDGTTPLETAVLQPPHLAAVIAISPVTEWYRYYFELGAHRRNGDTFPGSSDTDPIMAVALGGTPGPRTQTVEPTKLSCVAEFASQTALQDNYNAYWQERDIARHAANITVPVLYAQGWQDENVATTMVPRLLANLTSEGTAWLQQHRHGVPGSKTAFHEHLEMFLHRHMLGIANGAAAAPRVIVEDNLGKYRAESHWPPRDATLQRLHLQADGTLTAAVPKDGTAAFTDDGTGATMAATEGTTWLQFTSGPLPAWHVAGVPRLHVTIATSMPDTIVAVLVHDVAPDGTATFLTRGYVDLAHREHLETKDPVAPGTAYTFAFDLHPRDHRIGEGHALRLTVKSTDDYVVRSPYRATNTLSFGDGKAFLDLPTIDGAGRTFTDEAPFRPSRP